MQLIIEAKDLSELKTRIQNLNNELNFNVTQIKHDMTGPIEVTRKQFPPELQQAVLESQNAANSFEIGGQQPIRATQTETKPAKKSAPKKVEEPVTEEPKASNVTKRGKVVTKQDLQDLVQQLVNKKGMPKVRAFLNTIGVDVLRNVPEDRFVGVYDALRLELQA